MGKMTFFEVKVRTYLKNTENFIDIETLELIKMAFLDEGLNLVIPAKKQESDIYKNYWEKFSARQAKKLPVEIEDPE